MDPNACWACWKNAEEEEAREAARDLLEWLRRGGFSPSWSTEEAAYFFDWAAKRGL